MLKAFVFIIILLTSLPTSFIHAQGGKAKNSAISPNDLLLQSEMLGLLNPDSAYNLADKGYTLALSQKDVELQMRLVFQRGLIQYNRNLFDDAIEDFTTTIALSREQGNESLQALATNRLGNAHQLKTNYLLALECYVSALSLNRVLGNRPEEARTLVNLANVFSVIGQYQRSIELFLEAMSIHEIEDEKEGLAWTSLGIARLFKRLNLHAKAMQYAQIALEYYREIEAETGNAVGTTLSLNEIGSIYHRMGQLDKAKEYTHMVLVININNANVHGQAANHLSLGTIFFEEGRYDFARTHLLKSLSLKEQVSDSIDLARLFRFLGQAEMNLNRTVSGLHFLNKSLEHAQNLNLLAEASESYLSLSRAYATTGLYQQALYAYTQHTTFKDSLNLTEISRLEMQYEFEKREKEQELLAQQRGALQEARLERQRAIIWFFIVALLITGTLAAFIFWGYREKQRINSILVAQNAEITRQKSEIQSQKEEIEQQRDFVTRQRDQIADQQRLITDSITYASRIQTAVLPSTNTLKELPWDSFVLYKPKNIVSGDFYWVTPLRNGKILLAVADCTGHGVPGAFMSMLGITLIREIAENDHSLLPGQMLTKLRGMVMNALNQHKGESSQSDGMDMSLVLIDPINMEMNFAGAYLPAIIVRKGNTSYNAKGTNPRITAADGLSLIEFRGDKMPIGQYIGELKPFTDHTIQLQPNDTLYLFSDGYIDQFGGDKGVKFLLQTFKKLLLSINCHSLLQQKEVLSSTIQEYQGNRKQVDDMIVMGIRF
jgi:serine phosphatase RsbU (regulator of sigma subunit)/tetratricopeptide (TPR) repeat protein